MANLDDVHTQLVVDYLVANTASFLPHPVVLSSRQLLATGSARVIRMAPSCIITQPLLRSDRIPAA